ncbi:MAG: phosphotriesterase-related protein [Deltaproteobacteria bacterium]|nr:phosphotriesterase-related protein [Deltaproteobacteria bacterium]
MAIINSVLGPLDTTDLSFTLMHEHIMVAAAGVYQDYPELLGSNLMDLAVEGLIKAKEGGVDTVVDLTTLDLGRNIELLAEASRRSGVNIIACAGWWLDVPRFFAGVSADQMAGMFIREIEQGISGTDIKAGLLKSASDILGVTPDAEIMLRGVARAHLRTGVPIALHSYSPGQIGRQQLEILKEEGVNLSRVKLDHSNDTTDVEYLTWLLDQGCFLGLDRYPGWNVSPLARTRTMKALLDAGYADRLCPSHDGSIIRIMAANPLISEEERLRRNPHGFLYIKKVVFPQLRDMGVSEEVLRSLCVDGPRNFFEGA